ncbi:unnamed protein product [Brassicogethes aeneus]|uniref:DUF4097 domain-containing protein n=1 Tax=Brassicogethes aeneus TaxID=1431903 RepID=A0A9P0B1H4_BRAAE|nr:unnamed protein product [Brassicogethes aeneus]
MGVVKLINSLVRNFSRSTTNIQEITVPTFSNLMVNVPSKLHIESLNVHKYPNCDRLILEENLEHCIEDDNIKITNKSKDYNNNYCSAIVAPIKANLDVKSKKDVLVGSFNNDFIKVESDNGNISLKNYYGDQLNLVTNKGNIEIKGPVQSSKFFGSVYKSGSITTGKLHCLDVHLKINEGFINISSSYSEKSKFEANKGELQLNNIHKNCTIILKKGKLNLAGFDGNLNVIVEKGDANIQISRLIENSAIKIENGNLNLKLSEECQETCEFKINSKNVKIDNSMNVKIQNDTYSFQKGDKSGKLSIECLNGDVNIESSSWEDLFKSKFIKKI